MPILGGTGVLLDVVRPNKVDYEGTNRILPYIFSPYYMYDKRKYPQFLSGSGNLSLPNCFIQTRINSIYRSQKTKYSNLSIIQVIYLKDPAFLASMLQQ